MARKKRITVKRPPARSKARKAQRSSANMAEDYKTLLIVIAAFFGVGILGFTIFLVRDGYFERKTHDMVTWATDVTGRAGFSVQDIVIEGRNQTSKDTVLEALDVHTGTPILAFDPQGALKRVQSISWVRSSVIERRMPHTIYVRLAEREPMAVWQNKKQFKLIDRDGHTLRDLEPSEPRTLPLVVGDGANEEAAELLSLLDAQRTIQPYVKAATRVGKRRWDLYMNDNIIVKLPEDHVDVALERLNRAITAENILERKITGIDLRLPDRMVVETDQVIDPGPEKKKKSN